MAIKNKDYKGRKGENTYFFPGHKGTRPLPLSTRGLASCRRRAVDREPRQTRWAARRSSSAGWPRRRRTGAGRGEPGRADTDTDTDTAHGGTAVPTTPAANQRRADGRGHRQSWTWQVGLAVSLTSIDQRPSTATRRCRRPRHFGTNAVQVQIQGWGKADLSWATTGVVTGGESMRQREEETN